MHGCTRRQTKAATPARPKANPRSFRWTNQGIANQLNLTGWVRNNSDGSVEMEIQGPPAAIAAHLDAVHAYYRRFNNRIWLDEEQDRTPQTDSKEFEVRY